MEKYINSTEASINVNKHQICRESFLFLFELLWTVNKSIIKSQVKSKVVMLVMVLMVVVVLMVVMVLLVVVVLMVVMVGMVLMVGMGLIVVVVVMVVMVVVAVMVVMFAKSE